MDFSQLKVLIIDDDNAICDLLETYMDMMGIYSKYTYTLKEGIEALKESNYNVIFLDNKLPDGKGVDYLKKGYFKKNSPFIILMTGFFSGDLVKDTLKAGVNEFILKPFKFDEIEKILFKAKNFIESFYDFKAAVNRLEYFNVKFVIENNINLIKGIGKILLRNVVDANFFDNENQPLIAISEVISNAIYHGNLELESSLKDHSFKKFQEEAEKRIKIAPYKDRKVYINGFFNKEKFVIEVEDEGNGFDWKGLVKKLNFSIDTVLPYGRGIFLLITIFDEVYWNDKGNKITLIKYKVN